MELPVKKHRPDRKLFREVILGQRIPDKTLFFEIAVSREIRANILEEYLHRKWVPYTNIQGEQGQKYIDNFIETNLRLGYDYVSLSCGISFPVEKLTAPDTAADFSKGNREWAQEGSGPIASWEDFDAYPWPELTDFKQWRFEYLSEKLPEGMGMIPAQTGFFEIPLTLLGFQGLSLLLYDQPDLVEAVFQRTGEILLESYQDLLGLPSLEGFLITDDMGFNTSTIISPDAIRKLCLPWHKKLADLAHESGLYYILHSCGNIDLIMEDLIKDVGIDAKHSFEDNIMPVTEVKKKYGDKITILGGVDMDKLCRFPEQELRNYVKRILEICAPGGRYMLGSGNSISNYVPLKNYLIMLEEGG
jgi:uroporphyrinogen decarboxylase